MQLKPHRLLEYAFAFVLVSAAMYRTFNFSAAQQEMVSFGLPVFVGVFIILVEFVVAAMILFNYQKQLALIVSLVLMSIATLFVLITHASTILQHIGVLFVLNPTPTDVALHVSYIIVIIALLLWNKK